jgi:tetratricopeptide (TPR) repeat protein
MIVFLSDHGESLGDHGEKEHGFFVYNSTIRVPLVIKPPAGFRIEKKRVSYPVELIAVAPTVLRVAHLKDPIRTQFQSQDLLQPSTGNDAGAYSETFYPFSSFGWNPLHSLETGRYHYIEAPDPELYEVANDPEEKNNIASQQTAVVGVLKHKLQQRLKINQFARNVEQNSELSAESVERLRALGYLAYRAPASAEALAAGLPDPKSRISELNTILQASDFFRAGDFPAGEALLSKVRESDPKMYVVPFLLGEAANKQHKWEQAAIELKKSLALDPNFDQAMTGLAQALANLGDTAEAKSWIEKALQYNPQNFRAWYELGHIESKTDPGAAAVAYQKAIAIQPNFALVRRDLGLLQFGQKNYAEAVRHLAKAIEFGLEEPALYNFLGISYSRTDQLAKAVKAYRLALKMDPRLAEAHLNLGYAYQRMGQVAVAKSEYDAACSLEAKYCSLVPDLRKK